MPSQDAVATRRLVSRCGKDRNYAKVPRVMRRDRMYLRKLFADGSDKSNILMHLNVVLADQPAKHPRFLRRDVDALHLKNEVPNQGVSSSRGQIYKNNNRVWRVGRSRDNDNRAVAKHVVTPWKAKIRPAFEIIQFVVDALKAVDHLRALRFGIDPASSCCRFHYGDAAKVIDAADMIPMAVGGYYRGDVARMDAAGRQLIHSRNALGLWGPLHRRDQPHVFVDVSAKARVNQQVAFGMPDENGCRRKVPSLCLGAAAIGQGGRAIIGSSWERADRHTCWGRCSRQIAHFDRWEVKLRGSERQSQAGDRDNGRCREPTEDPQDDPCDPHFRGSPQPV